ncbi:MAG: CoA transferase [Chloroflexi bacterium]|jgi:crotonobetainyl-CoA:carnitine CoA-transferase CaiB-like acyl-CoA transferase|nr:CoA transferase [Chloroflexota bacterium]
MSAIFPFAEEINPQLPLSGVKVVDLTRLLPGPHATLMLADLGADVLKVEDTQQGDYLRWGAPPGENPAFMQLNRNKRSITLDLKQPAACEIFKKIVAEADILLESFRPGVMTRLGLGYEDLQAINPGLIYCSISGYGQEGPYKNRPGHDLNYIGYAGALGLTGPAGGAPIIPGVQIADLAGGSLMSLVGVLAALHGRQATGKGRMVDIAMTGSVTGLLAYQAGIMLAGGEPIRRGEWRLNGGLPEYAVYETADGKYLTVGALEPKFFSRLCTMLGLTEYGEVYAQPERAAEIRAKLAEAFKERTRDEWMEVLGDKDVCVGPAYELEEVFEDQQAQARGLVVEMEHPRVGKVKQLGLPFVLDGLDPQSVVRLSSPIFGEHNAQVLAALGYSPDEIEQLRQDGIVGLEY